MSNETFPRLIWLEENGDVHIGYNDHCDHYCCGAGPKTECYVRMDNEGQELAALLRRYIDDNKKLRAAAESDVKAVLGRKDENE